MGYNENCGRNSILKFPAAYGPVLRKISKGHIFCKFWQITKHVNIAHDSQTATVLLLQTFRLQNRIDCRTVNFPHLVHQSICMHIKFTALKLSFLGWIYDVTGNYDLPFFVSGTAGLLSGAVSATIAVMEHRKRSRVISQIRETHSETAA